MLFEEKSRIRDKNILHFYSAWLMFWVCFLCNGECNGQEREFTTFCNPINIDYQFNIDTTWFTGRNLWRAAADPVIVTYKGDYPQYLPRLRKNTGDHNLAGWMLLSYKKKARASSSRRSHQVGNAVDEDIQIYWSAATGHKGEWLEIDLGKTCKICAIQANFADNNVIAFGRKFYHQYQVEVSQDAENWELIVDKSNSRRDVPHDYFQLQKPVTGKFVRIKNVFSPGLGCFSIRDLGIFGDGFGRKPEAVNNFEVQRNPEDQRRSIVKWDKALRAEGYIVRYGILPNKLYNNYQIYEGNEVAINSLNVGVDYYFKVDSFNDSGISYAASIKQAPAKWMNQ